MTTDKQYEEEASLREQQRTDQRRLEEHSYREKLSKGNRQQRRAAIARAKKLRKALP